VVPNQKPGLCQKPGFSSTPPLPISPPLCYNTSIRSTGTYTRAACRREFVVTTSTNTQYQAFVRATGHDAPPHWAEGRIPPGRSNHPVVCVTWHDAVEFCDWLRAETEQPFRLPTEAEWEKAARGTGGRIYPWGDDPPDEDRCNFNGHVEDTTPIGRYSPQGDSPYRCADVAGNVSEWCHSLYRSYPYHAGDGRENQAVTSTPTPTSTPT
jgi:formylglycine-generating enzyme required for sulfatase activity